MGNNKTLEKLGKVAVNVLFPGHEEAWQGNSQGNALSSIYEGRSKASDWTSKGVRFTPEQTKQIYNDFFNVDQLNQARKSQDTGINQGANGFNAMYNQGTRTMPDLQYGNNPTPKPMAVAPKNTMPSAPASMSFKPIAKTKGGTGQWADLINKSAKQYGVDPVLLQGLIAQESGGQPRVVSKAGAIGLGQLMPATARGLGVTDPYNPEQNIKGTVKYLAQQLKTFGGDKQKALAAYNAGPNAVKKYGGIPPYKETQNYVKAIVKTGTLVLISHRIMGYLMLV